jgi:hypothetical protein
MDALDYETLPPKSKTQSRRTIFWAIFAAVVLPGSFLSEIVPNIIFHAFQRRRWLVEDLPLVAVCILASGFAALIVRTMLKNERVGWGYAVSLGLIGPTVVFLGMIVLL